MELDEAAERLYAVAPAEFVALRTELVGAARSAGDRVRAKEIGALRRPTKTAWLLNLLARAEPGQIASLIALGDEFSAAHRAQAGDRLRELSARRRQLVDQLTRKAVELGTTAGYVPTESARQEISATLHAALVDPSTAETLTAGRLVQPVVYGGFGTEDLAAALAASLPARPRLTAAPSPEPTPPEPDDADPEAALAAERARREAALAAHEAAESAARDAEAAGRHADDLARRAAALRLELHDAVVAEQAARETAAALSKRARDLRRAAHRI